MYLFIKAPSWLLKVSGPGHLDTGDPQGPDVGRGVVGLKSQQPRHGCSQNGGLGFRETLNPKP